MLLPTQSLLALVLLSVKKYIYMHKTDKKRKIDKAIELINEEKKKKKVASHSGNRTRAAWVKARNPNH